MTRDRLERARAVCHLAAAIEQLPGPFKIALQLRYLEGLTPAEVGQVMDIDQGEAAQLIRSGLLLLMARARASVNAPGGSA